MGINLFDCASDDPQRFQDNIQRKITTLAAKLVAVCDEMAIGVINRKTTATRIIPVPGKKAGEYAHFGGLLGQSVIMPVNNAKEENLFIRRGGLIPAPIHSLNN